jgi:dTDP-glucose 4,6-dehydratase
LHGLRPDGSEVERLLADNRLAHEIPGWAPRVGLEAGLQRTIKWMRQNSGRYRSGVYIV